MKFRISIALAMFAAAAAIASAAELNIKPTNPRDIYAVGDKIAWTVTPTPGTTPAIYTYSIRRDGATEIGKGTFDLAKGSAEIATSLDRPGMVYVTIDHAPPPGPAPTEAARINTTLKAVAAKKNPALKPIFAKYPDLCLIANPCAVAPGASATLPPIQAHLAIVGAAVAPSQIKPSASRPADFDAFWAGQLAALAKMPVNPVLTEIPAPLPGIKFYKVRLDSLGSHVQGYLAVPDKKGPFPAIIQYQWAGVYALIPSICAARAAAGWLCFNVDSHDMAPDSADGTPKNYYEIGNTARETSYFLAMYLRDTRALDWVRSLPNWNKKTLVVTGTSMGGHQSLVTAGLNPGKITAVVVNEPSGADTGASLNGRLPAYPSWPVSNPAVAETARYFDTANFTPAITAPTLAAIGFIDTVCPPATVLSAVNRIPAPHEIIPMTESEHNNYTPDKQGAFLQRSEEIFAALLNGGRFVPDEALAKGQ